MAAMPSNFTRLQPSSPAARVQPELLVNSAAQKRQFPNRQPTPRTGSPFTLPKEPEDARLTGGTRSLDRRLLALNLSGSPSKPAERVVAPIRSVVA
jgi:hypothetical protein